MSANPDTKSAVPTAPVTANADVGCRQMIATLIAIAGVLVLFGIISLLVLVLMPWDESVPRTTSLCDHMATFVVGEAEGASIVTLADGTLTTVETDIPPRDMCVGLDTLGESVIGVFQKSIVISADSYAVWLIHPDGSAELWPSQPTITQSEHYVRGVAVDEASESVVLVFPSAVQILRRDGNTTRVPVYAGFSGDWEFEFLEGRLLARSNRDALVLIDPKDGTSAPWIECSGQPMHGWLRGTENDLAWVLDGVELTEYRLDAVVPKPTGRTHTSTRYGRFILAGDAWQWVSSDDFSHAIHVECLECGTRIRLPGVSVMDAAPIGPKPTEALPPQ